MIEEFRHGLLKNFAGRPVFDFTLERGDDLAPDAVPAQTEDWAWRLSADSREEGGLPEALEVFFAAVDTTRVRALVIGIWVREFEYEADSADAIALLVQHAERFPALEALFFGDVSSDMCEVSWLHQADPGALFGAFPRLREFGLRGTTELTMEPIKHDTLEELTFQGGGLPAQVVRSIVGSRLPALTGIELYLGTPEYGGDAEPADLGPILRGEVFPNLRHLGLRDAENADEIAAALAHAPVVAQLESLDLSLGNMSDEGAAALLSGQPLTHLSKLDLHHHYLSDEMMQRVRAALPGPAVNLDEQEEADVDSNPWVNEDDPEPEPTVWRYVAVAE